ncbi:LAGLIDADG family homing endonuclease [Patescibacteria group bacterium AH-259-L05]|nr:LAGLIDADG family homing endonuclease [Patescibacteria group bacterium AH-259-L05]
MRYINLKIPEHSYFFGFVQMDGNLNKPFRKRDKGRLRVEIGEEDLHILETFQELFPNVYSSITSRVRDTNFKINHRSYTFNVYGTNFREEINKLGLPYGKKSEIISSPRGRFCERDYIRGLIDGDGSLGLTGQGFPFISLTVKSEKLKEYFLDVVERITGEKKKLKRNKRDNIYNIMINRERAQKLISYLYYPSCLALNRKLKKTKIALQWKRPKHMKRVFQKFWEAWEDEYILNHIIEESCEFLKRTDNSVRKRLWRLKNNKISL